MATFTTEEATNFLRACLSREKNPMPFLIVEYAHKMQNFTEIETRLQGRFGFHDHAPSLQMVARDAVCNIVLEWRNHMKFRDLKIGDKFKFTGFSFTHTCTKTSARTYTWQPDGASRPLKSKVSTIEVKIIKQ